MVDLRDTIPMDRPFLKRAADRVTKPSRWRRFCEAVKRNLFPPEPMPFANYRAVSQAMADFDEKFSDRVRRQAPTVSGLIQHDTPVPVTLPRHQVVMLRQGFEEMLKWAISERDCFFNSVTTHGGHVPDREDRITLEEMDAEIDRAQYTLREFDKVFHA